MRGREHTTIENSVRVLLPCTVMLKHTVVHELLISEVSILPV